MIENSRTLVPSLSIDVVIPSYGRPMCLQRCLAGLDNQSNPAAKIIVVARADDVRTVELVQQRASQSPNITLALVTEPGVIAAMNAGIQASGADVVAIIDDDAIPRPDWLQRLVAHYNDPSVIGVGGKDLRPNEQEVKESSQVGLVLWFGKSIGNHHAGVGTAREVHVLKGVNCSYRGDFIRRTGFDGNLLGQGSQPHWEISLGASARKGGHKLIYDPEIVVDHNEAARAGEIGRVEFEELKFSYEVFNYAYGVTRSLGGRRFWNVVAYCALVGSRRFPGILSLPRSIGTFGLSEAWKRFRLNVSYSLKGAQKARSLGE